MQNNQKSIHIVIFTGGLYPAPEKTACFWKNPLHGQPDYVIAADSGLDACLEYNRYFTGLYDFNPHKILGDFDSISSRDLLKDFEGLEGVIEDFPMDKDFTDTELAIYRAFEYAEKNFGLPYITLIGGDGGRIDHLLNIYYSFAEKKHPDAWLCAEQAVYSVKKQPYFVTVPAVSDCISFANVLGISGKIKSEGLEWESDLFRKSPFPSVSNRIKKSYFEEKKPLLVEPKALGYLLIGPLGMGVTPAYHRKQCK